MSPLSRAALTLVPMVPILILSLPAGASAQEEVVTPRAESAAEIPESREATPETGSTPAGEAEVSNYEFRNRFTRLLLQHPRELATILALDPRLLSNEAFLAGYPDLARFVAEHPEVRQDPSFYLVEFRHRRSGGNPLGELLEGFLIFGVFLLIALALAWLVRTIIEQKRWNRLSRTQSEVHNKILDRFGTSEELLEYVRTPAGTRFLESAPIPLHADRASQNPPLTRVLWSIQIGVVVAAAGLGMLLVSGQVGEENAHALLALGVIGLSVGAGFVASAAASLFLSRRLGLWEIPPRPAASEPPTPPSA